MHLRPVRLGLHLCAVAVLASHNLMVDGGFLGGVMTGQVDVSALMAGLAAGAPASAGAGHR